MLNAKEKIEIQEKIALISKFNNILIRLSSGDTVSNEVAIILQGMTPKQIAARNFVNGRNNGLHAQAHEAPRRGRKLGSKNKPK